jgi:hypothetical protein
LWCEGITVRAKPAFIPWVITIFPKQIHICNILIFESHGFSSLEHEYGVTLSAQGTGKGSTPGTTADDDDVVMAVVDDHG